MNFVVVVIMVLLLMFNDMKLMFNDNINIVVIYIVNISNTTNKLNY